MAIVNPGVYGAGGLKAYLVVEAEEGAEVTAACGDITLTSVAGETGVAKIKLSKPGDWSVTVTENGKTSIPQIVTITEQYPVVPRFEYILRKVDTGIGLGEAGSPATASVGKYVLFAFPTSTVAVDEFLTVTAISPVTVPRAGMAAASVGGRALFAGGLSIPAGGVSYSEYSSVVEAYDGSLTLTMLRDLSVARTNFAGVTAKRHAVFAGGSIGVSANHITDAVDAYSEGLTRVIPDGLSITGSARLAGTAVGQYAVFAGGCYDGNSYGNTAYSTNRVTAYNEFLTRTVPTGLGESVNSLAATTVGNHALFGGGEKEYMSGGYSKTTERMNAYNEFLTQIVASSLSQPRGWLAAATAKCFAVFAGGATHTYSDLKEVSAVVDAYDGSLTHSVQTELSVARSGITGASIGDHALFAGGSNLYGSHNTIDVYVAE